ncbi:MAG: hypothetical protein L0Z62_08815, partial [Gemmataceae bacterium]|nr:hypothetical protein [Gemmataceae bacterium]
MARWWMGAVLVTLGLAGRAAAQPMVPPPGGSGPMPMVPTMMGGPGPASQAASLPQAGSPAGESPGPMSHAPFPGDPVPLGGPEFCPPGGSHAPDSPLSLPNDGSPNAFGGEDSPESRGPVCYVTIGWMALTRERLGHGPIAYLDPGTTIPGVPFNTDTGNGVSPNAPVALDFKDIHMNLNPGVRATVGYRDGDHAIEASGFYLFQTDSPAIAGIPGRLDLLFAAFPSPIGFQGNNFLWLQADQVRATVETTLASAEVNYRWNHYRGLECL